MTPSSLPSPRTLRPGTWLIIIALLLGGWWAATIHMPAQAQGEQPTPIPTPTPLGEVSPDANCRMCHTDHNFRGRFQNGDTISLYVDVGEFENSVHGPAGLECIACHPKTQSYPHQPSSPQIDCTTCHPAEGGSEATTPDVNLLVDLPYQDHRAMTLDINEACRSCHEEAFKEAADSMHVRAMESGNRDAPVCVDCHGSHDIQPPDQPRAKITSICGECHHAVYTTYQASVHGAALMADESNPDVPTCIDCHGVHSVRGPRSPTFRNDTIAICGECHSDPARMDKYHVSTDVYRLYLQEFHGRSVNLARMAEHPSIEATCYDCHGTHNIQPADDPRAMVSPENIQTTCQKCHPGAGKNFPKAWMGHEEPTLENEPVLAAINIAYGYVLVPGVIGGFLFYIALDARKRWLEKRRRLRQAIAEAEKEIEEELGADYDFYEE
ncbi:MAG: hypothetical protein GXO56_01075 [Chloroflexi bacterium]|nr:hypothetical protein [Chloroflexota bacterium]